MSEALRPHRVHAQGGSDDQNNKRPDPLMSPQARGSAGGRRRHDPASQEDHDKPYVCDSKYGRCRLPSPAPSPALPCAAPAAGLPTPLGPASPALMPAPHQAPPTLAPSLAPVFLHEEEQPGRPSPLGAVLLSLGKCPPL